MTKFVGAEYLIASMLIENAKAGKKEVAMEELGECGIYIQQQLIEQQIDAVFMVSKSQVFNAIYDFTDYFEVVRDENEQITGIAIKETKEIDDLEYRFMGYLSQEIIDFLFKSVKEYAA